MGSGLEGKAGVDHPPPPPSQAPSPPNSHLIWEFHKSTYKAYWWFWLFVNYRKLLISLLCLNGSVEISRLLCHFFFIKFPQNFYVCVKLSDNLSMSMEHMNCLAETRTGINFPARNIFSHFMLIPPGLCTSICQILFVQKNCEELSVAHLTCLALHAAAVAAASV